MFIQNPLDNFQSYSVHYIMLACRTTIAAKKFSSDDDADQQAALQAIENAKYLGSPITLDSSTNDAFLILDTRRFSQFSVESLKYDVYINGLQKGASTSNLATDLEMVILDSVGISFANFMQWILDEQMKTNYDGLIFMLRTIFVGHNSDGTTETIQAETIPMHLNRMEINLDYAKGAYTLEFMPNMNFDVNRYGRFLNVAMATTYATGPGNKLGALIDSFEKRLNDASKTYFDQVQTLVQANTKKKQLGRKVEYMITIPTEWYDWEVVGASPGAITETVFKKANTQVKTSATGEILDSYTSTQPGSSIPAVLDAIFVQVPNIAEMGNFKSSDASGDGSIKFYKHIVGLTSSDESFCVHVDVVEFEVPNLFRRSEQDKNSVSKFNQDFYVDDGTGKQVPKDFIEYNYIFTGLNKDILNFELKIQDFQFLLASNLRIGDNALRTVSDTSGGTDDSKVKGSDELLYAREFDPLFLPENSAAALRNFSNYTSPRSKEQSQALIEKSQQYTRNLSMFYAASPITVAMTIKGNPAIMHKFNIGKVLPHSTNIGSNGAISKKEYRTILEDKILKSNSGKLARKRSSLLLTSFSDKTYATSPVFAKVNIMGPNVDFRTNQPASSDKDDYAVSVLSDPYYTVFRVTNNISSGVFTQDLELYSHNVFGKSKITAAK